MKEKCNLNFVCNYLDVYEDIPFFHHSNVTCFQSSNIRHQNLLVSTEEIAL